MEYCSIYYTCFFLCVHIILFFLFFFLMLPHNLNFPKITSPPLCNDISSLMRCLLVRGRDNLSFTWDSKQQQSFNQFPMKNVNSAPTFFLVQEEFHSDTHITIEKKRLLQLLFITLIITQSTLATALQRPENHPKHACEFCMITFSANPVSLFLSFVFACRWLSAHSWCLGTPVSKRECYF